MASADGVVRIGTLGAARITPNALLAPASELDSVAVVAVAARDLDRAETFAQEHGIERVHRRYEALIEDDSVDAVYNPLPNAAHGEWTLRALRAGKHVLCEKPMALNAGETEELVAAADELGLVLMEALHWRYHPAAARTIEVASRLGPLERGECAFLASLRDEGDIRYQLALGGGATMDLGCYCLHALRSVVGEEPEVLSAVATEGPAEVDVAMDAELAFPGGLQARMRCSFQGPTPALQLLALEGRDGRLRVENPFTPQRGHRLTAELADGTSVDEELTHRSSYVFQLEAFVEAVCGRAVPLTGGTDAIANQRVIDACYTAAGLLPR